MKLYVATRKGLFEWERRGRDWRVVGTSFLGDPVTAVLPAGPDGDEWAALNLGHFGVKMHRRRAGEAWGEIEAPVYPERPEPEAEDAATDVPWSLVQVWCLERDARGRVWAGTLPGGLFASLDDGGWELDRGLWDREERGNWFGGGYDVPGIHSISFHPSQPDELTVAVSCGGAWRSGDAGRSWELRTQGMFADYMPPDRREDPTIQDPHLLTRCKAHPEVLWVQHHNGAFRSTDEGRSWTSLDVSPSSFGFAVAAHPLDPDTAWFVPAIKDERRIPVDGSLVVARTRDGGRTFEVLRRGLPQVHAYDLVFRHALDVSPNGEILAFGSTTGSLWISENGGDEWVHLSGHLPPIYAVRFG